MYIAVVLEVLAELCSY